MLNSEDMRKIEVKYFNILNYIGQASSNRFVEVPNQIEKQLQSATQWLRSSHRGALVPAGGARGGFPTFGSYRFFENGDPFEAIWCNMCTLLSVFQA